MLCTLSSSFFGLSRLSKKGALNELEEEEEEEEEEEDDDDDDDDSFIPLFFSFEHLDLDTFLTSSPLLYITKGKKLQ
jgi:hypothetical protein